MIMKKNSLLLVALLSTFTINTGHTSPLATMKVVNASVPIIQVLDGQVEAINKSTLSAQTSGTIEVLNYDVGDFVKKGQVIARIKSRSQKAGLQQAQASVGKAKATVGKAKATVGEAKAAVGQAKAAVGRAKASVERARAAYKASLAMAEEATSSFNRISTIYKQKLIARSEYDRALAASKTATAQVRAGKAALNAAQQEVHAALQGVKAANEGVKAANEEVKAANEGVKAANARRTQAGEQLGYTSVIAPYSGIVVNRHVELGEAVTTGKPLITGISLKELRVTVAIPQTMIAGVRKHKKARIFILGDNPAIKVKSMVIFPYADPTTNAFKVRLELKEGADGIFPGTFVKVVFVVGKQSQLVVPESAIAYRGEVTAVYVLNDEGQPFLRQLRLGRLLNDGNRVVLSGLTDGELVVKDPIHATLMTTKLMQAKALEEGNDHE